MRHHLNIFYSIGCVGAAIQYTEPYYCDAKESQ